MRNQIGGVDDFNCYCSDDLALFSHHWDGGAGFLVAQVATEFASDSSMDFSDSNKNTERFCYFHISLILFFFFDSLKY